MAQPFYDIDNVGMRSRKEVDANGELAVKDSHHLRAPWAAAVEQAG